ncbi:hypothetical protein Tco_0364435 [Tanacetum coccineum]
MEILPVSSSNSTAVGDEGLSSRGTKQVFITAEVTFTKPKQTMSLARGFFDQFSLESSGTSDTHRKTRSTSKIQKTPSKNKEPPHLRRSKKLEDRSITKEKARRESFYAWYGHPELAKKLNEKIPKTMNEIIERVMAFIRGEVVAGSAEMGRPSQGDKGGHNTNDCYQLKKQIEEAVALGKLAHLVKDIRQNNQRNRNHGRNGVKVINMIREEVNRKIPFEEGRSGLMNELTFSAIPQSQLMDELIILEGIIEGNQV